jgi:hypothetical protein
MKRTKRYTFYTAIWLVYGVLQFAPLISFTQNQLTDFVAMSGTRFTYPIADDSDSLSAKEIVELRDEKGLPIWFGREFHKVVCLTGQCRMVHLWLFWDGAGNYLGFQPHPGEPLSKTDHSFFSAEDYRKLHRILSDSVSVLKNLKQEDLVIKPDKPDSKVDAVSSATQPSLQDYLVRNAAYTCYTLWHTAYGSTRNEVLSLVEKKGNKEYLSLIFEKDDLVLLRWAVRFIQRHPEFHANFYRRIIDLIKSKNEQLSQLALNYFSKKWLTDTELQRELSLNFAEFGYQRKFELLWKLSETPKVDNEVVLHLLDLFEKDQINASLLGYTHKLIRPENIQNEKVLAKLNTFSGHPNLYVRNIIRNLLSGPALK